MLKGGDVEAGQAVMNQDDEPEPHAAHPMARRSHRTQVQALHYAGIAYNCKKRLASYWHQADEVLRFAPRRVLEVGPGSGFVTRALRAEGISVTTLDFADDLKPDVQASVLQIPLPDNAVEVALCCQVLEHLPFEQFPTAVAELARVASRGLVLSLPDRDRFIGISLFGLERHLTHRIIEWPRRARNRPVWIDEQHYWEIGARNVNLQRVQQALRQILPGVPRTYRVMEHPWHRFFVADLSGPSPR